MNREIKFRVWDKGHEIYLPLDVYDIHSRTSFCSFGMMRKSWKNYSAGEYFYDDAQVLEQFTGIKDSNGRDVYEGDILRSHHFADQDGKQHYLHHKVVWSEVFMGWRAVNISETEEPIRTKKGSPQLWVYVKDIKFEVIGNIYEHTGGEIK